MRIRSFAVLACMMAVAVFLPGCKEKLTRVHYDMLKVGVDTKLNVETTLGEPDAILGDTWRYNKHDRHLFVRFDFDKAGKVAGKSWADGKTGEWAGAGTLQDVEPEGRKAVEKKSHTTVDQ